MFQTTRYWTLGTCKRLGRLLCVMETARLIKPWVCCAMRDWMMIALNWPTKKQLGMNALNSKHHNDECPEPANIQTIKNDCPETSNLSTMNAQKGQTTKLLKTMPWNDKHLNNESPEAPNIETFLKECPEPANNSTTNALKWQTSRLAGVNALKQQNRQQRKPWNGKHRNY